MTSKNYDTISRTRLGMLLSLFAFSLAICTLLIVGVSRTNALNGVAITIAKTTSNATPTEGDTFQYVIEVTSSDLISPGLTVTDILPAGLTYAGATFAGGAGQSWDPATGTWFTGIFNDTFNPTLTITARADLGTSGQTITNTASTDTGQSSSVPVTIQQAVADLSVSKVVDDATPVEGDPVSYDIVIANNGPNTALNVDVEEVIPAGIQLTTLSTTGGSYDVATNVWSIPTMTVGSVQTLTLNANVLPGTAGQSILNTATVIASDAIEGAPGDETASASIMPTQGTAELAVTKNVSDPTPEVNDVISYTVTIENAGPDSANDVDVTDLLPAGLNYLGSTFVGTYDPNTGIWALPPIPANTTFTLTIDAQVLDSGLITNTAFVSMSEQIDTDSSNDTASAVIDVPEAMFTLTKIATNPTPNELENFDYVLEVTSDQNVVGGIVITDVLPTGIELINATGTGGTGFNFDQATGVWDTGDLSPAFATVLTLTVRPEAGTGGQTIINTATGDMGLTSSATINVPPPNTNVDLAISKSVSDDTPVEGESITYVIVVENLSATPVTNVEVTENSPAGIDITSELSNPGSFDFVTEIWTIPSLAGGQVATLTLTADVQSGFAGVPQVNTVTMTAPNATGLPSADATITPELGTAELSIAKSVSDPMPTEGDFITYTVVVENAGPADATNVVVDDLLPSEVRLDGGGVSGSYDAATGVWTLPTLVRAGNTYTLTLRVEIDAGTAGVPITNMAEIVSTDQIDDPADNSDDVVITPAVGTTDMCISISVDDVMPEGGDTVVFTVELSNVGPIDATNLEALIPLPAGLNFAGFATQGAPYDPATGVWGDFASQSAGITRTLVLTAVVDAAFHGQTITTTATVGNFDQNELSPANNTDSAVIEVVDITVVTLVSMAENSLIADRHGEIGLTLGIVALGVLTIAVVRREHLAKRQR